MSSYQPPETEESGEEIYGGISDQREDFKGRLEEFGLLHYLGFSVAASVPSSIITVEIFKEQYPESDLEEVAAEVLEDAGINLASQLNAGELVLEYQEESQELLSYGIETAGSIL